MNEMLIPQLVQQISEGKFDKKEDTNNPFQVVSHVSRPEIVSLPQLALDLQVTLPDDLNHLWNLAASVHLNEDVTYGQWGLVIWKPSQALSNQDFLRSQRASNYIDGDLIIGEFLGDSDLLLIRCDPQADDFGSVIIVLPLDARSEWYYVATSLAEFLQKYLESPDRKYWE